MNSVLVAVGMGLLFVYRSMVDGSMVDGSMVDGGGEREGLGCVVSSVVREVVRLGLGEDQKCEAQNKELRMMRAM